MKKSKYRNLVIIGNGFGRWLGLPSSYESFRRYYLDHIKETLKKLNLPNYDMVDSIGNKHTITAVESIYGDPFQPAPLEDEFFWNFEMSLDKIDDQLINLYFGRSEEEIRRLQLALVNAQTILMAMFTEWIFSLKIPATRMMDMFSENCFLSTSITRTHWKKFLR